MQRQVNPRLCQSKPVQRCVLDECQAACCQYGVWIDRAEAQAILDNGELIKPHMPAGQSLPSAWFDQREELDEHTPSGWTIHSRVLPTPERNGDSACVFLRKDHKCALQVAAQVNGLHPWRFKPFYCILHPLDLDEEGRITLDEAELMMEVPGSCLRPVEQPIPLLETFEQELRYLLGDSGYLDLVKQSQRRLLWQT